jgi:hypothetical protein
MHNLNTALARRLSFDTLIITLSPGWDISTGSTGRCEGLQEQRSL